jgi:hypothetical protein
MNLVQQQPILMVSLGSNKLLRCMAFLSIISIGKVCYYFLRNHCMVKQVCMFDYLVYLQFHYLLPSVDVLAFLNDILYLKKFSMGKNK